MNINRVYNFLFVLLFASLPYESMASALPNIILIGLGISYLSVLIKRDLIRLGQNHIIQSYLVLTGLVLFISLFKGELLNDLPFLRKLLIPLILIIFSSQFKNYRLLKMVFIVSVFTAILISSFNIYEYIIESGGFKFSKGNFINEILVSERLYLGLCSVISIVFSLDFLLSPEKTKLYKSLFLINICFLTSFIFFIAARIAILTTVLIFGYYILRYFKSKKHRAVIAVFFIILVGFFFSANRNLTKRFLHLDDIYRNSFIEKIKTHEPRYDIWKCSFSILKEQKALVFGLGNANAENLLVDCYKENIKIKKRQNWFVERKFNTHNQFLGFLLSYGTITLLAFMLFLYKLFLRGRNTFLGLSLLGAIIMIMLVENIFNRQVGCYLIAFSIIVIMNMKKNTSKNE